MDQAEDQGLMHWQKAVQDLYGIDADLQKLDGEYDLNFRVLVKDGTRAVLKVMRPGCDRSFIDMQCRALEHLTDNAPGLPTPHVIHAASGDLFTTCRDEKDRTAWSGCCPIWKAAPMAHSARNCRV